MEIKKVLNGYCGIGGNRAKWNTEGIQVTAIENNPDIAAAYKKLYPNDIVIVGDAHEYLLKNYMNFDFIWMSPPCQTHTKLRLSHPNNIVYPDMRLYQEIILLQQWFKGKYCIENVDPYYEELIKPTIKLDRHCFWSNFDISLLSLELTKSKKDVSRDTVEGLSEYKGIDLSNINIKGKRLLLRNAVHPKIGLCIFESANKKQQKELCSF